MNKTTARAMARDNKLTIAELRELIDGANPAGMSRVNPTLPKSMALDIYRRAVAERAADETPKGTRFDVYRRREIPSKDALIIANILIDCAP